MRRQFLFKYSIPLPPHYHIVSVLFDRSLVHSWFASVHRLYYGNRFYSTV